MLITHAWAVSRSDRRLSDDLGPDARSFLLIAVETPPAPPAENDHPRINPSYSWIGDSACILLAILFGKRFDYHGIVEQPGLFGVPRLDSPGPILASRLPFHSDDPRADLRIPLNLGEFRRLASLLNTDGEGEPATHRILAAGRHYLRAVRTFPTDPELAYLDLITCGEAICASGRFSFGDDVLYDDDVRHLLDEIRCNLLEGERKSGALRGRLRQVKRRFVRTLLCLLTESFFSSTEALEAWCRLRPNDIEVRLKAAYDVRSKHLHEGRPFGRYLNIWKCLNETRVGRPVCDDRDWSNKLGLCPSFVGLERIMRYCLLRLAHLTVCRVDCRLDGPGLVAFPASFEVEQGSSAGDAEGDSTPTGGGL